MIRSAEISDCGKYRWSLSRHWDDDCPEVCFVMLNPSTADGEQDDPTIRKCMGFARRWGYGGIDVVNLFAFRSTQPKALLHVEDPTGGEMNALALQRVCVRPLVIAAWGQWVPFNRSKWFLETVAGMADVTVRCLGLCKNGEPFHPLYQPYSRSTSVFCRGTAAAVPPDGLYGH